MKYNELLVNGAVNLGVNLTDDNVNKFDIYLDNLLLWSSKINLTGIKDEKGIVINHFLDSLSIKKRIRPRSSILDIGTGAGFPGIPLGIVDDTLNVKVIDSVEKKIIFIKSVIRDIKLKNITVLRVRADSKTNVIKLGTYDYVVTRAVSDIQRALTLSGFYVSNSGIIILMRGKDGVGEWNSLSPEISDDFILSDVDLVKIPFSNNVRTNLYIQKKLMD